VSLAPSWLDYEWEKLEVNGAELAGSRLFTYRCDHALRTQTRIAQNSLHARWQFCARYFL
jgi:hypothetical protein